MNAADLVAALPAAARRRAESHGAVGRGWLDGLRARLDDLADRWGLSLEAVLDGGSEALALAVRRVDGRAAVLKLAPPWANVAGPQTRLLQAAQGRGYAELYALDAAAGAILIERLGRRLDQMGWTPDAEMAALCAVFRDAWTVSLDPAGLMDGRAKAQSLIAFIEATAAELDHPLSAAVISRARAYAEDRATAHDGTRAVIAHGDGHAANALQGADGVFRFIDPDGLFIEPAYDLGVLMREWPDDILAGDAPARGRARSRMLADHCGVDAEAVWRWGYLETVSTGLLCCKLDIPDWPQMFQVAEAWARAD